MNLNKKYWNLLNNLDVVSIVAIAPRPGTDFIHSLFDSHPEVLTFDGWLLFHNFFQNSISIYGTSKFIVGNAGNVDSDPVPSINPIDFFNEFAWTHLHKFDSRYDTLEKKNKLGSEKDEFNLISIDNFVKYAVEILGTEKLNSKNALLAVYGSYALVRNEDLAKKKLLLHHVHLPPYVESLSMDFKKIKIICCMRDPRVYGAKINKYLDEISLSNIFIGSAYSFFEMNINGANLLNHINNIEMKINVLEKLHQNPEKVMRSICKWLKINYHSNLLKSTWNGKKWHGDSLSNNIDSIFTENRYIESKKRWINDLSLIDRIVVENLMGPEMKNCGYKNEHYYYFWFIFIPLFILFLTKYEIKIIQLIIKEKKYHLIFILIKIIMKRYLLSYRKYFNNIINNNIQLKTF